MDGLIPRDMPIDKSLTTHPSLFQTPEMDKRLNNDANLVRSTNPNNVWDPSIPEQQRKHYYNANDPPISNGEIARIISRLNPVQTVTLDNSQPTLLFFTFMSQDNVNYLQSAIKKATFEYSGYRIQDQSLSELLIVMQNIYVKYAANVNESRISRSPLLNHIKKETKRLDDITVKTVLPGIINGIEQLKGFIQYNNDPNRANALPRPVSGSTFGTREYRDIHDVFSGGQ